MKYFSMFSGIGGFELGILRSYRKKDNRSKEDSEREYEEGKRLESKEGQGISSSDGLDGQQPHRISNSGVTCIGYSEIDKYSIQTYQKHFGGQKNYGDATNINPKELPNFDLLVGGFPCQAFSIAGKRRGFQDTRGTLFFEIARVLKAKQPRMFLLENVKGLLNHDKGETFTTILKTIDELGYDAQWQVLNSKHFGVPQNRERVFIIGHLRGTPRPKVFPLKGNDTKNNSEIRYAKKDWQQWARVYDTQGISPTLAGASKLSGDCTPKIHAVLTPNKENKRQEGRRFKEEGEEMFTLTGQDIRGIMLRDGRDNRSCLRSGRVPELGKKGYSIRRLTPIECERLQGFPELESFINFNIHNNGLWIDLQKSYVNVEIKNHKSQKYVLNVGREESKEDVLSVEENLNIRNQQTDKHVLKNVHISCVEEKVEILNQKKSLEYVNYVENQDSFLQYIKTEDFVQMIVGINTTLKKIINNGKEGLLQKGLHLIRVKDGKLFANLSGKEIMRYVEYVKKDSTILKKHLKSIILNPLNLNILDSEQITSFFYVISAIIGCIQKETQIRNSLKIDIYSRFGYTYGVSDSQRYKQLGNAVTVNVIQAIIEKMMECKIL